MGYIILYDVSFISIAAQTSGVISYRLTSDPDVPGSYTTVGSRTFNTDGSIVGGPVTIPSLAAGNYTVKIVLACGEEFSKTVNVPVAPTTTTTTTSTTTTSGRIPIYITACYDWVGDSRTVKMYASMNVPTDVQIFFELNGTSVGGSPKAEASTQTIFTGTNERIRTLSGGSNEWGSITSMTIPSSSPSSFGIYDFVIQGPFDRCSDT